MTLRPAEALRAVYGEGEGEGIAPRRPLAAAVAPGRGGIRDGPGSVLHGRRVQCGAVRVRFGLGRAHYGDGRLVGVVRVALGTACVVDVGDDLLDLAERVPSRGELAEVRGVVGRHAAPRLAAHRALHAPTTTARATCCAFVGVAARNFPSASPTSQSCDVRCQTPVDDDSASGAR